MSSGKDQPWEFTSAFLNNYWRSSRSIIHRLVDGPAMWELGLSSCHDELGEPGSNWEE